MDTTTLEAFLNLGYVRFGVMPNTICADAGYGREENYNLLDNYNIEAYVKYNYFHVDQKPKLKNNPFRIENPLYDKENDSYICPAENPLSFFKRK